MITGGDKLDINFVDGEYSIYHSRSLNAKPTKQIYVPIILTTNTIHPAEEEREATNELCYGRTTGRAVKNA